MNSADEIAASILAAFEPYDYRTIELEFRLGRYIDHGFRPGVSREHFQRLLEYYESTGCAKSSEHVIEHVTHDHIKKRVRMPSNDVEWMVKWRIMHVDTPLYRIAMASEYPPLSEPTHCAFTHTRHKRRTSFYYKIWRVDLTCVTSNDPAFVDSDVESFEVELELADTSALFTYTMTHLLQWADAIMTHLASFQTCRP